MLICNGTQALEPGGALGNLSGVSATVLAAVPLRESDQLEVTDALQPDGAYWQGKRFEVMQVSPKPSGNYLGTLAAK